MRILLIEMPIGSLVPGALRDDCHDVQLFEGGIATISLSERVERVARQRPHAIWFGRSGSICTGPILAATARAVRESLPDIHLVYGGLHPACDWRKTLIDQPWVDVLVRDEGEETAKQLMCALEAEVPLGAIQGIAFRRDGEPATTCNADNQPSPFAVTDALPN